MLRLYIALLLLPVLRFGAFSQSTTTSGLVKAVSVQGLVTLPGSGTAEDPYLIGSYEDLKQVSLALDKVFSLTADIDCSASALEDSGRGFVPIGENIHPFSGTFHGNFHLINNLTINRPGLDDVGLFGRPSNAIIDRVTMANTTITGKYAAGALIGNGSAYVYSCRVIHGIISCPTGEAGGLVGMFYGTMEFSYADVTTTVTAGGSAGGLIGDAWGFINYCYSLAAVTGVDFYGGFVGNVVDAIVKHSYAAGYVSPGGSGFFGFYNGDYSSNATFYDVETSGAGDALSTGATTAQMKTASTFISAGWDFTTIWEIIGTNYPTLRVNPETPLPVTLQSFAAAHVAGGTLLKWSTASELNNRGFDLERRPAEGAWSRVAFIQGGGTRQAPSTYSYLDDAPLSPGRCAYRLKQIDYSGAFKYSQTAELVTAPPAQVALYTCYPNPFNPSTTFRFDVPAPSVVRLAIYDVMGRELAVLADGTEDAGMHEVVWEASGLPSGTYFARLIAGPVTQVRRLMLVK